jgi:hypothetical protein
MKQAEPSIRSDAAIVQGRGIRALPLGTGYWLVLLAFAYAVAAFAVSPQNYLKLAAIYLGELVFYVPVLALALPVFAPWMDRRRPFSAMVERVRRGIWPFIVFVLLSILFLAAFTTLKLNVPKLVPFYADRTFADIDEWLHGGPPWQYLHAVDPGWFASLTAIVYGKLWFLQWFGLALFAAFDWRDRCNQRYLCALALTIMLVGTVLATPFASVGPVFYDRFLDGDRFAGLLEALAVHPANDHVIFYADYLLENFRNDTAGFGTGISAMPSVHVAVATLNALYLSSFGRWQAVAGWIFALLILLGSVYTGWHYALDGYISMLVVVVIWQRTRFLADECPA